MTTARSLYTARVNRSASVIILLGTTAMVGGCITENLRPGAESVLDAFTPP